MDGSDPVEALSHVVTAEFARVNKLLEQIMARMEEPGKVRLPVPEELRRSMSLMEKRVASLHKLEH